MDGPRRRGDVLPALLRAGRDDRVRARVHRRPGRTAGGARRLPESAARYVVLPRHPAECASGPGAGGSGVAVPDVLRRYFLANAGRVVARDGPGVRISV